MQHFVEDALPQQLMSRHKYACTYPLTKHVRVHSIPGAAQTTAQRPSSQRSGLWHLPVCWSSLGRGNGIRNWSSASFLSFPSPPT